MDSERLYLGVALVCMVAILTQRCNIQIETWWGLSACDQLSILLARNVIVWRAEASSRWLE